MAPTASDTKRKTTESIYSVHPGVLMVQKWVDTCLKRPVGHSKNGSAW
jgi:hypothetical protein